METRSALESLAEPLAAELVVLLEELVALMPGISSKVVGGVLAP
jgi:hypothetical protein